MAADRGTRWPALPVADWQDTGTRCLFYAYAYPEPTGFRDWPLDTPGAAPDPDLGEFVLPYRTVRESADPEATLLGFLRETAAAAAELARWPTTA